MASKGYGGDFYLRGGLFTKAYLLRTWYSYLLKLVNLSLVIYGISGKMVY